MKIFLMVIFFLSISIIVYTYFIYPLVLCTLARFHHRKNSHRAEMDFFPSISMVIPTHNEEEVIEKKLKNCLELDYPKELIEFVVSSDGSTDRTNELVSRCSYADSRIKLFAFDEREGKASVLNKITPALKSDIIIFSDANTMYERDSIKKLVRHFSDPTVGGVCGKLMLAGGTEASCSEEGLYWNYENRIKELESQIKTIAGINGQIFAIRRELFEQVPADSITEDQVLGMKIIEKGYDILFEPRAICRETPRSLRGEFLRRIRISTGNFQSITFSKNVLNPMMGFASFALWSHKILRWLVPFLLIVFFISNLFLFENPFFRFTFFVQVIFYLISVLYYGLTIIGVELPIFKVIFYYNIMNLAILLGFLKFITRTQKVAWKKIR